MGKRSICSVKNHITKSLARHYEATLANIGAVLGTTVVLMTPFEHQVS